MLCQTGISGRASPRRVGLSRPLLGSVVVKSGSEKFVHRPGGVIAHVLEDVSIPPEGHRRVGVAKHPRDRVERYALAQGQGAGGVTQVVESDIYWEVSLLEESPEGAHHGVAPTDLAFRVWEHKAGIRPGGRRHPLLALPGAVCLEDLYGARANVDLAVLAGLGGGDARLRTG